MVVALQQKQAVGKNIIKITKRDETLGEAKISLEIMREIWNDKDNQFTDIELIRMREFAYLIMEAVIQIAKDRKRTKLHLDVKANESKESHTIHPCEYRRAS